MPFLPYSRGRSVGGGVTSRTEAELQKGPARAGQGIAATALLSLIRRLGSGALSNRAAAHSEFPQTCDRCLAWPNAGRQNVSRKECAVKARFRRFHRIPARFGPV